MRLLGSYYGVLRGWYVVARVFWEVAMWMLWCSERLLGGC